MVESAESMARTTASMGLARCGNSCTVRAPGRPVHGGTADARRGLARRHPRGHHPHDQGGPAAARPEDLVERKFNAQRPDELWVVDFTYVATWPGFVYVAFCIDVYSRLITGWRCSASMKPTCPWTRWRWGSGSGSGRDADPGLVHHSDAGSPVHLDPLHRTARRGRCQALDRLGGRLLRQRDGRVDHRPVQDRGDPLPRTMAQSRRGRDGHPGVGRLVQQPPPLRGPGRHPTGRGRIEPTPP